MPKIINNPNTKYTLDEAKQFFGLNSPKKKNHWLGRKHTMESRKKISEAQRGKKRPHKGGYKFTEETKQKMRNSSTRYWLGKHISEETKKKLRNFNLGKKQSEETKRKKSEAVRRVKSYLWRGGISTENEKVRHSLESKLWQESVRNRDCNCCQKCGESRVSKLTAHHILNFSTYKELRFAIDNGISFCKPCHKEFHGKYGYRNNNDEQVKEFICQ